MKIKHGIAALLLGLSIGAGTVTLNTATASAATSSSSTAYAPITKLTKVSYYTTMGTGSYSVYASGAYNTSAANRKAISTSRSFANQAIHITREEVVNGVTWLKFTYNHKQTGWVEQKGTVTSTYKLYAPMIGQRPQLPTGCEITATAMMLQFGGAKVDKMSLAKEMPRSSDPNKGFVGSPYSSRGWYVFPGGLMGVVKAHMGTAKNMTGASLTSIKNQVRRNHLVVVWVANVDGFSNHALTVTGYSKSRIYYNDPWTKQRTSMSNSTMTAHRKADANRALSY
ncbi:C39 family peptidase [Secundilactobacillus hailunensis]|uniref:C39 family peptidase n=1 Tax=Secundilactobacillus hailunensis TaxID=2559923 RepID=A0ABW1TB11_9LACO|nr:C39 family peptidase [Secundilactobacillus hailunensis]